MLGWTLVNQGGTRLQQHHFAVGAVFGKQFCVRPHFQNSSLRKHHNPIRMRNRAQAVRDHKARSVTHQFGQAFLYESFIFRIQITGGLVQYQDLGVGQDGTCDGQALTLPTTQFDTPLANQRLVPFRQLFDEFVGVGRLGSRADLPRGGVPVRVTDIFSDRPVEQEHVLFDDTDQPTTAFHVQISQVATVQQHTAIGGIVEACHQVTERRFAGTARSHQRDRLTRFNP